MNLRKLSACVFSLVLAGALFSTPSAQAQEGVVMATTNVIAPLSGTFDPLEDGIISGVLSGDALDENIQSISFRLESYPERAELWRSGIAWDESFRVEDGIVIPFEFDVSENLITHQFSLVTELINTKGRVVAKGRNGLSTVDVFATPTSAHLAIVSVESVGTETNVLASFRNGAAADQVRQVVVVREHSAEGVIVASQKGLPVAMGGGETKEFTIGFATPQLPEAYIVEVFMENENGDSLSGIVRDRLLVEGDFAEITSLILPLGEMQEEGDTVEFLMAGVVDEEKGNLKMDVVVTMLPEEKGVNVLQETRDFTAPNDRFEETFAFTLPRGTEELRVDVKILRDSDLINENTIEKKTKTFTAEKPIGQVEELLQKSIQKIGEMGKSGFELWMVLVLSLAVIVLIVTLLHKKKRLNVLLFLILPFIGIGTASADWDVNWQYPLDSASSGVYFNPASTEGFEEIVFVGSVYDELTGGFFMGGDYAAEVTFSKSGSSDVVKNASVANEDMAIYPGEQDYIFGVNTVGLTEGEWDVSVRFSADGQVDDVVSNMVDEVGKIRIDTTDPVISFAYSPDTFTNAAVDVTVTCEDGAGAGCLDAPYDLNVLGNFSPVYNASSIRDFKICDKVQNCVTSTDFLINWYDATPPRMDGGMRIEPRDVAGVDNDSTIGGDYTNNDGSITTNRVPLPGTGGFDENRMKPGEDVKLSFLDVEDPATADIAPPRHPDACGQTAADETFRNGDDCTPKWKECAVNYPIEGTPKRVRTAITEDCPTNTFPNITCTPTTNATCLSTTCFNNLTTCTNNCGTYVPGLMTSSSWSPDLSLYCEGVDVPQTGDQCDEPRTETKTGTKTDEHCCAVSSWTQNPDSICEGITFTQTSSPCGTTRDAVGTKTTGNCAKCGATTISNCDLVQTDSGGTDGTCDAAYPGNCSYTCTAGTWGDPSSNDCTCVTPNSCPGDTCTTDTCVDGCGNTVDGTKTDGACTCTSDGSCVAGNVCMGSECTDNCGVIPGTKDCSGCSSDGTCVAGNICTGSECTDNCGNITKGTKDCSGCTSDGLCIAGNICIGSECTDNCGNVTKGIKDCSSCSSDGSCVAGNICTGSECTDNCGHVTKGTKDCSSCSSDGSCVAGNICTESECTDNCGNVTKGTKDCSSCSSDGSCVAGDICTGSECTDNCGHVTDGIKDCSSCTDTIWLPAVDTKCQGVGFNQTSDCGNTQPATGTMDCTGCGTPNSCPGDTCTTDTCEDGCGNTINGTKDCGVAPYSWDTTAWGSCDVACGSGGTQTRMVVCEDSLGTVVDDSYCTDSKPDTSQSCTGSSTCNDYNSCTDDSCISGSCDNAYNTYSRSCTVYFGTCGVSGTKTCSGGWYGSCVGTDPTIANCSGKVCGSDGCGGTCDPGCPTGDVCNASGQCEKSDLCTIPLDDPVCDDGVYCTKDVCINAGDPDAYCDNLTDPWNPSCDYGCVDKNNNATDCCIAEYQQECIGAESCMKGTYTCTVSDTTGKKQCAIPTTAVSECDGTDKPYCDGNGTCIDCDDNDDCTTDTFVNGACVNPNNPVNSAPSMISEMCGAEVATGLHFYMPAGMGCSPPSCGGTWDTCTPTVTKQYCYTTGKYTGFYTGLCDVDIDGCVMCDYNTPTYYPVLADDGGTHYLDRELYTCRSTETSSNCSTRITNLNEGKKCGEGKNEDGLTINKVCQSGACKDEDQSTRICPQECADKKVLMSDPNECNATDNVVWDYNGYPSGTACDTNNDGVDDGTCDGNGTCVGGALTCTEACRTGKVSASDPQGCASGSVAWTDVPLGEVCDGQSGVCDGNGTCALHYFTTAETYDGNLGGLSGAGAKCNSDSNKKAGISYKAIILDCNLDDSCRFWAKNGTYWANATYGLGYRDTAFSSGGGKQVWGQNINNSPVKNCNGYMTNSSGTQGAYDTLWRIGSVLSASPVNCNAKYSLMCAQTEGVDMTNVKIHKSCFNATEIVDQVLVRGGDQVYTNRSTDSCSQMMTSVDNPKCADPSCPSGCNDSQVSYGKTGGSDSCYYWSALGTKIWTNRNKLMCYKTAVIQRCEGESCRTTGSSTLNGVMQADGTCKNPCNTSNSGGCTYERLFGTQCITENKYEGAWCSGGICDGNGNCGCLTDEDCEFNLEYSMNGLDKCNVYAIDFQEFDQEFGTLGQCAECTENTDCDSGYDCDAGTCKQNTTPPPTVTCTNWCCSSGMWIEGDDPYDTSVQCEVPNSQDFINGNTIYTEDDINNYECTDMGKPGSCPEEFEDAFMDQF